MTTDRRVVARLRAQARQARASGHYAVAARLERQAVEWAGALGWTGERTRALLWEGYSLWQAGEDDLALAALLQAANERAATADPADVFAALIALVRLSLDRKSAAFCRALLDQARRYLADLGQPWSAPLDFLDGEWAYRRGEFAAAWDWHSRAWAGWRDEHPRLTAATHLWALCRTAFRRREAGEVARLAAALAALSPLQALERPLVQRAQLLDWRARRICYSTCDAAPVELALTVLATPQPGHGDGDARREAVRALALAGQWEAVAAALSQRALTDDRFESALLLGDLALNRARAALGWPAVDDDSGEAAVSLAAAPEAAPPWVEAAGAHYQTALLLAEAEDTRLETGWHGATVRERLARL